MTNDGYESGVRTYDFYNYGYILSLSGSAIVTNLYRTDYYEYKSTDNTITLSLSDQLDKWRLYDGVNNYTNNTNERPIGNYGEYILTYVNE